MTKSNKRDAWTYLIVVLLVINLFVVNNYITNKAIIIIEAKNNTSTSNAFNIETLKQGVTGKYSSIVDRTKIFFGMANNEVNDTNSTTLNIADSNDSKRVPFVAKIDSPVDIKTNTIPPSNHEPRTMSVKDIKQNTNGIKPKLKGEAL